MEIYICTGCGQIWRVPRSIAHGRPLGHRKHMFCARCQAVAVYRRVA